MHRETEQKLESLTTNSNLERAKLYLKNNLNKITRVNKRFVVASLTGNKIYRVLIENLARQEKALCTCPYNSKGLCKHSVAVLLALSKNEELIEDKSLAFGLAFFYKHAFKIYIKTVLVFNTIF